MNISMEEKKKEAIVRMRSLGLDRCVISRFHQSGTVCMMGVPFGKYFTLGNRELERMRHFERENNDMVYAVIRSFLEIGQTSPLILDSYLFVSDIPEEWEMEREELRNGETVAYIVNWKFSDCSELGYIGIKKSQNGSLFRIW